MNVQFPTSIIELSITTFDTIDEAIELANMSDYTLSSSLWTSDLGAAEKLAPQIRTGEANGLL